MTKARDLPATIPLIKGAVWLEGEEGAQRLGAVSADPESVQGVAGKALGVVSKTLTVLDTPVATPDGGISLYDLALVRCKDPARKAMITKGEGATGAMVALMVPPEVGARMAGMLLPGADPAGLHITLLYLGKADALDDADRAGIVAALDRVSIRHPPLQLSVGGIGKFAAGPDGIPVYASATGPGLSQLQADLEQEIDKIVELPSKHGWVPHITLGYLPEDGPLPTLPADLPTWTADKIRLQIAGEAAADPPLTGVVRVARNIAKSDAKRVIYYVNYEPRRKDAHGEEMTDDEVMEMTWRNYGCRKVKIEHGFDQGLKEIFGKDEFTAAEGIVVEHFTMDREIHPGGEYRGVVIEEGIHENACMEAIRYSPEVYRVLSNIEHGISLGGTANTRTVDE